jgi:hypothetical protein
LEEYKTIFENYYGYYIYKYNEAEKLIIKFSFQEHLILQRVFIENGRLVEGDKIVLEQITDYYDGIKIFTEKGIEFNHDSLSNNSGYHYVVYNPNEKHTVIIFRFKVFIHFSMENYSNLTILELESSFFTKNSDEVIDIFNNFWASPTDEQRRYTGDFIFHEYEIINIKNMVIPFSDEEIKNDQIIVAPARQWIVGRHIPKYHINMYGYLILTTDKNGQVYLGEGNLGGSNWSTSIRYYYIDYDTLIYEHRHSEIDNDVERCIEYKIIFKRKNISD